MGKGGGGHGGLCVPLALYRVYARRSTLFLCALNTA